MLFDFFLGLLLVRHDYFYLTPQAKVNLERRISVSSLNSRPQISTKEVTQILNGLKPRKCAPVPHSRAKQIVCLWQEGKRKIEVFYHGGDTTPRWTFQRWQSSGDW
jgi:hypothetical protein